MSTTTTTAATAPRAAQHGNVPHGAQHSRGEDASVNAVDFARLLRQGQGNDADTALVPDNAHVLQPDLQTDFMPELAGVVPDLDTLVGQTRRLDSLAQMALPEGGTMRSAGLPGAGVQAGAAPGQTLATVAMGVQGTASRGAAPGAADMDASGQQAIAAQVGAEAAHDAGEAALQSLTQRQSPPGGEDGDVASGRITLDGGQWRLLSEPASPAMQRLVGQIEQWAAASAGPRAATGSAGAGAEAGAGAGQDAASLHAGGGSGTRLLDSAVTETTQSGAAARHGGAEADMPQSFTETMRLWAQGQRQRAEVVIERDGVPLRVQVALDGSEAHIHFRSGQEDTRSMLDAGLAQLRDMLATQGVTLVGASVTADTTDNAGASHGRDALPTQQVRTARIRVQTADGNQEVTQAARAAVGRVDIFA